MRIAFWSVEMTLAASLAVAASGFAQTCVQSTDAPRDARIVFRNGDVLTGELLSRTTELVRFRNRALGEVSIPQKEVAEIDVSDCTAVPGFGGPRELASDYDAASESRSEKLVKLVVDNRRARTATSALLAQPLAASSAAGADTPQGKKPAASQSTKNPGWLINVNAPASVAFGTTSQETFGGSMRLDFYEGARNHSQLAASGTYNRAWQVGSPSIYTDVFDGFFQQGRSFGPNRGGLFARAEWFLNTSLGLALQESFAPGYYSPVKKVGPFNLNWLADIGYFHERLYKTAGDLNLVGSRIEGKLNYMKMDATDATKLKYSIIADAWIVPMWNNQDALQAAVTFEVDFPIKKSVCFAFNPIDDYYMRNPPAGHKTYYATSSATLKVQHGSNPKQRCY